MEQFGGRCVLGKNCSDYVFERYRDGSPYFWQFKQAEVLRTSNGHY